MGFNSIKIIEIFWLNKKDLLAPLPKRKELILWGPNGKALTCLLMMDGKLKSMKLKVCGYKMRLVAFALDRVHAS